MPFSIFKRKPKAIDEGLEQGWQFYARPNTLEQVGYVFRIDGDGVRFPVVQLAPKTMEGPEAGVRVHKRIEAKAGVLARFLDLIDVSANASVGRTRTLDFEIREPIRILSTDSEIETALDGFLDGFTPKDGNRYYVIRQTRSASSMSFRITSDLLAELGGEAAVSANVNAGLTLNALNGHEFEINQTFPERLLVTFQPERIERVSAGLAGSGAYGLTPVTQALEWREPAAP